MILVDSNIPMYFVGAPHAHKSDARRSLEKVVSERQSLVMDVEVLQEILPATPLSTAATQSSPPSTL